MRLDRLGKSRRQEAEGIRRFGGSRNPRSGARWDRKNDGRTPDELVEFKRTDNRSQITLKFSDLRDLEYHALTEGRYPVLGFELAGRNYVVLTERDYFDRVHRGVDAPLPREGTARILRKVEMPRNVRERTNQPILRRVPAQRTGAEGQERVPGHASGPSRPLSGGRGVPRVRPRQRGEVGRLGRVLRAGATSDQETTPS